MDLTRNWWAPVLRGIVAILFGVFAFLWPGITLGALVLLFGAYALIDGIFAIAAATVGTPRVQPWWALLLEGVMGITAGVLTFFWPGITALALLYLIGFWAITTGIFEVVAAIQLRKQIEGEWALALGGILSILFGVALVAFPGAGALAVIWFIAAYAIAFGILLITLGIRMRTGQYIPGRGAGWPA